MAAWYAEIRNNSSINDAIVDDVLFGSDLYKCYDKVFSTEEGRAWYNKLHQYDKTEQKIVLGAATSLVGGKVLQLLFEFGSMFFVGETAVTLEGIIQRMLYYLELK